jgi:hypothetical protein
MSIIKIGIKKIELGYFSAYELGIVDEKDYPGFAFFYVQHYFHIIHFPIISLGCKWVMIQQVDFYDVPMEYKKKISEFNLNLKPKWYPNLGLILFLGGNAFNLIYWITTLIINNF